MQMIDTLFQEQTCGGDPQTTIVLWCSIVKRLKALNKLGHSASCM